jgi:hypothetical protein
MTAASKFGASPHALSRAKMRLFDDDRYYARSSGGNCEFHIVVTPQNC